MYQLYRRSIFFISSYCLLLLCFLSACVPSQQAPGGPITTGSPPASTPTAASTSVATPAPMPPTLTTCPPVGTARAAVMVPLTLGAHQNVVYIFNQGTLSSPISSTLRRYDTTTTLKKDILNIPSGYISEAHVSADGQWVMFTQRLSSGRTALQLVRMDGQGLQTLHCSDASTDVIVGLFNVQWTPDQRSVAFVEGHDLSAGNVKLLNITTGALQTELQTPTIGTISAIPTRWLDNTHLYMTGFVPNSDAPPQNVYLLDTANGANQTMSMVKKLITVSGPCYDFDSSSDSTRLFFSRCNGVMSLPEIMQNGPSSITAQPAMGGSQSPVYNNPSMAITSIRMVSDATMLVLIGNTTGSTTNNGLWKMHLDGTGMTRLVSISATQFASLNIYSQYTWSNVSRDGNTYALKIDSGGGATQTLNIGTILSGGSTPIATFTGSGNITAVGWTTMA